MQEEPHTHQIIDIDLRNRFLVARGGVSRAALNAAVAADGYECADYLAAEIVLPDGSVIVLGDKTEDVNGYDLLGLVLEADIGIITEVTVRLIRISQAASIPAQTRTEASSVETQRTLDAIRTVFRGD